MSAISVLSIGLLGGGGSGFPDPFDVRLGVDNGDGDLGTLTSPPPNVVLKGQQYGGGGTQYAGTLFVFQPETNPTETVEAWEELYDAQTESIGYEMTAVVGIITAACIASEANLNEILKAGGLAEAGGITLQMRASDFANVPPPKLTTAVTALGQDLVVLSANVNNGIFYIVAGDPVAQEP